MEDNDMVDSFISFKYSFNSGTGPWEEGRFIREIEMEIFSQDEYGNPLKLIGRVDFKVVYIDQAINAGYSLYDVFDTYEYTFRHAQDFFDFEMNDIKDDIQEFYNNDIISSNICLLERIGILPEYRGQQIAAKAIKDIIFHFSSGCALFILQAYPLQFDKSNPIDKEWQKSLLLNELPKQKKIAFKKLRDYYKRIGFDEISGYKELLFHNPARRNERLDAINLDE